MRAAHREVHKARLLEEDEGRYGHAQEEQIKKEGVVTANWRSDIGTVQSEAY